MVLLDYYFFSIDSLTAPLNKKTRLYDRMRKDELGAISGPNEFAEFYNRLKQIKEFHRKHPNEVGKLSLVHGQCKARVQGLKWHNHHYVFLVDLHPHVCRVRGADEGQRQPQ